jgi:Cache 3/Cache 2 fusion domain
MLKQLCPTNKRQYWDEPGDLEEQPMPMKSKQVHLSTVMIIGLIAALAVASSSSRAQEDAAAKKVLAAMALLQSEAAKLGPVKIEGTDAVAGKQVPAIHFGAAKINNNFDLVDDVVKNAGGTATIFVKSGDDYVRVATNVKKDDGSRAIGTVLDPSGKVIAEIRNNKAFYGEASILGKVYVTGYEPIRDTANNVVGIYYVGYLKE